MVVIPIPPDFNVDDAFQSESKLASSPQSLKPAPAPSALAPSAPAAVPTETRSEPPRETRNEEPSVSLSIADLIESEVPLQWPEVVAIAHRLCRAMEQDPAANVPHSLLEPRNITLTERGEVRVAPGGPGSDPIVQQIGRILRALLQRCTAPAGLRLLALQASFEVPTYGSVEELAVALGRFRPPEEADSVIRAAYRRGLEAKRISAEAFRHQSAATHALSPPLPISSGAGESVVSSNDRPIPVPRRNLLAVGGTVALLSGVLLWGFLARTGLSTREPIAAEGSGVEALSQAAATPPVRRSATAPSSNRPPVPDAPVPTPLRAGRSGNKAFPTVEAAAADERPKAVSQQKPAPRISGRTNTGAATNSLTQPAVETALRPAEASVDAIPRRSGDERLLGPLVAYKQGHDAFEAGDFNRAIADGTRALKMLDDPAAGVGSTELLDAVNHLLLEATAAKSREEERVYTSSDVGITPPAALSRQLPSAPPAGVPPRLVGRLEMLINQKGAVDFVKLHTPLNRYHERMIVSAAKAWRYTPALKSGKPVRYSLQIVINLPGSD